MTAQHPDDILAMRMMETARLERKRAAVRDGSHPGGLVTRQHCGPKPYAVPISEAGAKARAIFAENQDVTASQLSAMSGLTASTCREIINAGVEYLNRPRGSFSEAGRKARELFAADPTLTAARLAELSGLSRRACSSIVSGVRSLTEEPRPQRLEAEKMLRDGAQTAEVSAATGLDERWVRKLRRAMGLPKPPREAPPPPPITISPAGLKARAILAENPTIGSSRLAQLSGLSRTGARDVIQKAREARRAKVQA